MLKLPNMGKWNHLAMLAMAIPPKLEEKHQVMMKFCNDEFPRVPARVQHIEIPHLALDRARHSFFHVRDGICSWADFVDYTRAAQWGLLELEVFRDWWVSLQGIIGLSCFVLVPCQSSWGILVPNLEIFEESCHCNAAAFIEVPANQYKLNEDSYVLWAP